MFLLVSSILFIQKLTAGEPQGIAKDYGIDLQNPVTEVAQDVYSMHAFVTIIMAVITLFVLGLLFGYATNILLKRIKTLLKQYITL